MKIKDIPISILIGVLNDLCLKADIKPTDNELIANTLFETRGNVEMDELTNAIHNLLSGNLDIKPAFKMNNLWLSELLYKNKELKRSRPNEYQEPIEIRKTQEEIDHIFEEGLKASKENIDNFIRKKDKFFDPFFLFNEFHYLFDKGVLDPDLFPDEEIDEMVSKFKQYDKVKSIEGRKFIKLETPILTDIEYRKAAVVGLYLLK